MSDTPDTLTIMELFSRDPTKLNREAGDVRRIIEYYRNARHKYNLGQAQAGALKAPSKAAAKQAAKSAAADAALKTANIELDL